MKYCEEYKKEISFPLGGIGSGSIGLAGNGSFIDIEIFNKPNKGTTGEFTHFAIKAENEERVIDARVLHTDQLPGYIGSLERERYTGYGFGPDRGSMAGFPHFSQGEFEGTFPIAELDFVHENFPGNVTMKAFNPLIPTNEDDSSIPAAFFAIEITNTSTEKLNYSLALSCNNYYVKENAMNCYEKKNNVHSIFLSNTGERVSAEYGDLTIATDCSDVSFQEYWYRGSWFDNVSVFWNDFTQYGKLKNRKYNKQENIHKVFAGNDIATLAAHVAIEPGEHKTINYVLSWSMPYMNNHWQITHMGLTEQEVQERRSVLWKNYYASMFQTSKESAFYAITHFKQLYEDTKNYTDIMYGSTLPKVAIEAVASNVSILKSTTCLRLSDGSFYGFEGTHPHMGSCEGTCTHVWSYAYAVAFLFPKLERSARKLEYTVSMQPDGGMGFRVQVPKGVGATNHRPAVDGQYGTVMRVYREYMISGDKVWLKDIWQAVKDTIEYAWNPQNPDKWDMNKDGIMEGRQHHTLDMELFGANSWLTGMYLGGLKAGAELAKIMGDESAYNEYIDIFNLGVKKINTELFNGEYFCQKINLKERTLLTPYHGGTSEHSDDVLESYWNNESGEIKYQIGEGCGIDQILGQWHADLLGLGDIFDKDKVTGALNSIFKYNYIEVMREHANPCRIYSLNDESGTIICSYPEQVKRPHIPVPYAEETMHGFEYQAASHMILRGMEEEGLTCVKAIRDKYDGKKRNPWNEMECGSNYARSMASYALLLVYSGFQFNMERKMIGFKPLHQEPNRFFWSLDSGFGEVIFEKDKVTIRVAYGNLAVQFISLNRNTVKNVMFKEYQIFYAMTDEEIALDHMIIIEKGEQIEVYF